MVYGYDIMIYRTSTGARVAELKWTSGADVSRLANQITEFSILLVCGWLINLGSPQSPASALLGEYRYRTGRRRSV